MRQWILIIPKGLTATGELYRCLFNLVHAGEQEITAIHETSHVAATLLVPAVAAEDYPWDNPDHDILADVREAAHPTRPHCPSCFGPPGHHYNFCILNQPINPSSIGGGVT